MGLKAPLRFVRKYYWAVVVPLAALMILTRVFRWDVADVRLAEHKGTYPLLFHAKSVYANDGPRLMRRSQSYLLLPVTTLTMPYTVTVYSENGVVTVDEDRYALFKYAVFLFVIVPLVRSGVRRWKDAGNADPEPPPPRSAALEDKVVQRRTQAVLELRAASCSSTQARFSVDGASAEVVDQSETVDAQGEELIAFQLTQIVRNPQGEYFVLKTARDRPYVMHVTQALARSILKDKYRMPGDTA